VLTTTALLCGLLLVIFAEHSLEEWESGEKLRTDIRRVGLASAMFAIYILIFAFPASRKFFELNTMNWGDLGIVFAAVALWAVTVRVLWRYDIFERILVPKE
jgi:hypothetical protein